MATAHAQWEFQDSGTKASLRGVHYVSGGVAWASGTDGAVLRTQDGGHLWQPCATPPGAEHLDFRGIQAFDENTAIVMSSGPGDQSRLYKTTDGCRTWKLLFTNPDKDGFWDALFFETRRNGWLLGDPTRGSFTLFESSDSGDHWTKQLNTGLGADSKTEGAFAASNSSLFAKSGFVIFGTGGKSGAFVYRERAAVLCLDACPPSDNNRGGQKDVWSHDALPIGQKTDGSGIFSIGAHPHVTNAPLGSYTLIAVGGDYKHPERTEATSAYSVDGAKHWQSAQTPPHGYRSSVAYDPTTKTWITVGPNGSDYSTDDGRNWHPLTPTPEDQPGSDRDWNALSLPFVVGPHGRIGKLRPSALASAAAPAAKPRP